MYLTKIHYEGIVPEISGIDRFSASVYLQILHSYATSPSMQCV